MRLLLLAPLLSAAACGTHLAAVDAADLRLIEESSLDSTARLADAGPAYAPVRAQDHASACLARAVLLHEHQAAPDAGPGCPQ